LPEFDFRGSEEVLRLSGIEGSINPMQVICYGVGIGEIRLEHCVSHIMHQLGLAFEPGGMMTWDEMPAREITRARGNFVAGSIATIATQLEALGMQVIQLRRYPGGLLRIAVVCNHPVRDLQLRFVLARNGVTDLHLGTERLDTFYMTELDPLIIPK
jgi:hypothetical protein